MSAHPDLVALDRDELTADAAEAARAHVAACPTCTDELAEIRRVLETVREDTLRPTPQFTARLARALDAELARGPAGNVISLRSRLGEVWEFAQWRYERSVGVRRFVAASIVVHAAALLLITISLLDGGREAAPRVQYAIADEEQVPDLDEVDPPFVAPLDPIPSERVGQTAWSFPSPRMQARLRIVMDRERRREHLDARLGDLAPKLTAAMGGGLRWLAQQQASDGAWGAGDDAPDVRVGATAAAVLAFASDGRSSLRGEDARVIGSAVGFLERHLEAWLDPEKRPEAGEKPLYAFALSLRALTLQYAVDYPDGSTQRALLERGAAALADWQRDDGGFGYTPVAAASDSSCTLFAAETLDWLHAAAIRDTTAELRRAGRFLVARRGDDGVLAYRNAGDRAGDLGLTAALLALNERLSVEDRLPDALEILEKRLDARPVDDLLLLGAGVAALERRGRPVRAPVAALIEAQRDDGSWDAAGDRHCAPGGDAFATAMGIVGLTRTYLP